MPTKTETKPFLKWAGGKRKIVPEIIKLMPKKFDTYHEIFLGGGALFFALQPKKAILSDINGQLINAYIQVRDNVESLISSLDRLALQYKIITTTEEKKKNYYRVREDFNRCIQYNRDPNDTSSGFDMDDISQAARFIFLNKTCFNGLYRVNKKGLFNVPVGDYKNPLICDRDNLLRCSEALQGVEIKHQSYAIALLDIKPDDFVYADPPYVKASKTANFTGYTSEGFTMENQANLAHALSQLNCKWIASNSDTEWVRKHYQDYNITEVFRGGNINSNKCDRTAVKELLITKNSL